MPESIELRSSQLGNLPKEIAVPAYDRGALTRSIVHIGVGGFHRAHLATYVDEICQMGHTDWGIVGSGVLPHDQAMNDALHGQDTLFTVMERGSDNTDLRVIGSMVDYIHASPDPSALIAAIAADATQIVSLTVTEGGYPVDDATGAFDPASPNAADGSAFSIIVAALDARMSGGGKPVTLMSCDNIMGNGDVAKTVTMAMAAAHSAELATWVEANVAFPNSMVDRITPATTDDDRNWLTETYGVVDRWPVVCEPFRQWVIEDNFAGARPPLEELDIIITEDVRPYEHMKLQLLNAGHSCLAYAAGLLNIELVHDAMADPDVLAFVNAYLNVEAKTSLHPVEGMNFDTYIETLLERFANPKVRDQVSRLCQDGSGKMPKFVLPTMRAHVDNDGPIDLAALLLATWCEYLRGVADDGSEFTPAEDSQLEAARAAALASVDDPGAFLQFDGVFEPALGNNERVQQAFSSALASLRSNGVRATLQNVS